MSDLHKKGFEKISEHFDEYLKSASEDAGEKANEILACVQSKVHQAFDTQDDIHYDAAKDCFTLSEASTNANEEL